jgi:Protein of unknown function (DUF5672)
MSVVIVIHVYQALLNKYEVFSLKRLVSVTQNKYPIRIVSPFGLRSEQVNSILAGSDFSIEYFHPKYFTGLKGYNQLMMNPKFYKRFQNWDYILIHHLDALLFKDELDIWCAKGYSNIGAPLYQTNTRGWIGEFIGIGNGGLCLRKVKDCLKVLYSYKKIYSVREAWNQLMCYSWKGRIVRFSNFFMVLSGLGNRSHYLFNQTEANEDWFWCNRVPESYTWFKQPNRLEAAAFSMEYRCEELILENGGELPFGCHGWFKPAFISFWLKQMKKAGIEVDELD